MIDLCRYYEEEPNPSIGFFDIFESSRGISKVGIPVFVLPLFESPSDGLVHLGLVAKPDGVLFPWCPQSSRVLILEPRRDFFMAYEYDLPTLRTVGQRHGWGQKVGLVEHDLYVPLATLNHFARRTFEFKSGFYRDVMGEHAGAN
jgi:hypothetical protein